MDIFFDSYQLRKIRVLHTISSEDRSFTIAEIAEKIHTSAVTVDKNIESLIHDLEEIDSKSCITRLNTPQRAVHFQQHSGFSTKMLKKHYMKSSLALKLLLDIFDNHFTDIRTFSSQNFLSTTIVYRKVNALEEYLQQFQLEWDFSASFELSGSEINIRYFYLALFWKGYDYTEWPFSTSRTEADKFIQLIEKIQGHSLDLVMKEYYSVWFGVIAQRITQGHFFNEEIANGKELKKVDPSLYDEILAFLKEFVPSKTAATLVQHEVSFIYLIAYAFEYRPNFEERMGAKRFQLINVFLDGKITESTIYFIEELDKWTSLKLSIKEYDSLYLNIINSHLQSYFFPERSEEITQASFKHLNEPVALFFDTFFENLLEEFQKKQQLRAIYKNVEKLKKQYKFIFSDLLKIDQHLPEIHVTIFSKMGKNYLNYYKKMLASIWSEPICISGEKEWETDLIISDDFYEAAEYYENCLTFIWNEEPTPRDLDEIKQALTSILVKKAETVFHIPKEKREK